MSANMYLFTFIQLGQFTEGKINLSHFKWVLKGTNVPISTV